MPHQRYITDVALEVDPVTGRLWYDTVVLVIPRQNGKTTTIEPTLVHRARRAPDSDVVYTAQDRQMSRRRLLDELADKRLARCRPLAGHWKVRRSNGSESIRWGNGSQITTVAATDDAGHGLTTRLAVLDEAFAHRDLTMITALEPTMITIPDPQLWVVSTIGDGSDGLLQHYQDLGFASLSDPDTRICYFEWSALEDDDRHDPEVHRRVIPALGRTIDLDRIAARARQLPPEEFDRSYLCRRTTADLTSKIPPDRWAAARRPADHVPVGPFTVAAAVAADRSYTSIAVAGNGTSPGSVAVAIDRRPGVSWAGAELRRLAELHGIAHGWADRRGGSGAVLDLARAHGFPIDDMTTSDVVSACGTFYDLALDELLEVAAHPDLDLAAPLAATRPLGDTWAWSMRDSPVPVDPLIAATYAVGLHRVRWPLPAPARLIQ